MSLETAIHAHLISKTEITAIVSNRVLFGDVEPSREQLPQIVYQIHDNDSVSTLDGTPVDLHWPILEVEIRSDDPADIDTVSDLVRRSLIELETGATIGAETIEELSLIDAGTDEATVVIREDDDTVEVLRRTILARVGYRYDVSAVT